MANSISPCKGCPDRLITADFNCHTSCDRYLSYRAEIDAKRGEKYTQNQIRTHEFDAMRRMKGR